MRTPISPPKEHTMTTSRADLYIQVTHTIIADLEQGVRPWLRPWKADRPTGACTLPLRHNGIPYRGINILLLWGASVAHGFSSPLWMTYRQAQACKAQVRKAERGSLVVYADRFTTTETDTTGQPIEREIPFLKGYTVFNAEQIDGLPPHVSTTADPAAATPRLERAESFFAATGAVIRHRGQEAYYSPSTDVIVLPPPDAFSDAEAYASTTAHELTHWTKHPTRLDRNLGGVRFGDDGYAREELVAELGSAFLCAALGIALIPREDHAAYLDHWLRVLRADTRAIFQAASHAQRAVDYLHSLQVAKQDVA
jgi:antirestriction protein ArdC